MTKLVPLATVLKDIPNEIFFTDDGRPSFNRIFASVVSIRLGKKTVKLADFDRPEVPNISSFQRAVAKEASRRRKAPLKIKGKKDHGDPADSSGSPGSGAPPSTGDSGKKAKPTLEEAYEIIRKGAAKAYQKYTPLHRLMQEEDVAQGYFTHYLARGFHEKFDPEKKIPLSAWIGLGLRNWCCDHLRSKSFQFKQEGETVFRTISGDQPLDEEGNTLFQAMTASSEDPLSSMIVDEILELLEGRERKETGESPLLGKCRLGPRVALEHSMQGFTAREVGEIFGVSQTVAGNILREAKKELAEIL